MELEEKQDVFRSLQDTAELLSLENHPAKQTVEVRMTWGCEGQVHRGCNYTSVHMKDLALLRGLEEASRIMQLRSSPFTPQPPKDRRELW